MVSRREDDWPYKVPLGIRGILRNTPMPTSMRKSSVCSNSASPRNGRRVFFPPTKRVCYRYPLEEEITTVKFVARHSDLSSSDESESESGIDAASDELDDTFDLPTSDEDSRIQAQPRKALKRYSRRQIRAAAVRDRPGDSREQTIAAKTPSDRKKRRRWEWTLGPLEEESVGVETPNPTETSPAGNPATPSQGQNIHVLTDIPPPGDAIPPDQGQALPSPAADYAQSVAQQPAPSPALQSPLSFLALPQTIPLPPSPSDATPVEGGPAV
jgi:hypothetical protein